MVSTYCRIRSFTSSTIRSTYNFHLCGVCSIVHSLAVTREAVFARVVTPLSHNYRLYYSEYPRRRLTVIIGVGERNAFGGYSTLIRGES